MNIAAQNIVAAGGFSITPARDIGEAVSNLLRNGWTRLEYPAVARGFTSIIESFTSMTNDPDRHHYAVTDRRELDADGEPDIGLIEKAKGQRKPNPRPDEIAEGRTRYDSTKFTHHFKPRLLGYLGRVPGAIDRHAQFFLENARMYGELVLIMQEVAEEMDRQMPGYSFAARFNACNHQHVLRLLRYLCDGPPEIALAHRDQCFLTAHPRSDRSGPLWLLDSNGTIIEDAEETRDDSILLFLGRKAWEVTRGKLQGVPHGVKDRLCNAGTLRTPRHTAVAFSHVDRTAADLAFFKENASALTFPPQLKEWLRAA